jgi:hypothetical protein
MAILVALPIGAAFLALWLVARCPKLLPESIRAALAHFAASLFIVEFAPRAVAPLAAEGRLSALIACVIVLWVLVYAWLAVVAVLRTLSEAIAE